MKKIFKKFLYKTKLYSPLLALIVALRDIFNFKKKSQSYKKLKNIFKTGFRSPASFLSQPLDKVMLLTSFGHHDYAGVEAVVIKAFEKSGFKPVVLMPRDYYLKKIYQHFGVSDFIFWDSFYEEVSDQKIDSYLSPSFQLKDYLNLQINQIGFGKYAISSLMRQTRQGSFDFKNPKILKKLKNALRASLEYAHASKRIVDYLHPHALVCLDRGYTPNGQLFDACLNAKALAVTCNTAHKNNALLFKRYNIENRKMHPVSLSQASWDCLKKGAWTQKHWEKLNEELYSCYVSGAWYSEVGTQFHKKILDTETLSKKLELNPNKKTAVVFPHMFWDATFFFGADLFESYEEWFIETLKAASRNTNLNWIIKIHPANTIKDARDGITQKHSEILAIEQTLGNLPDHIKLIAPESEINTYSLYSLMDYGLTVRGTIGMEASCFGAPVLTAGTGRYDGFGFTIDPKSKEEYLSKLARLHEIPPLSKEQTELARRYAYGVFLCRPMPLKSANIYYEQDQKATLFAEINAHSSKELWLAPDVNEISSWLQSHTEDYLNQNAIF